MTGLGGRAGEDGEGDRHEAFARVLTHDLRNPLEVATIRLETAAETGDTAHVEPALAAVERMSEIIDGMETLLLEGADAEGRPVGLAACARDAWRMVDGDGVELDIADDLGEVSADPALLQELLENLFANALAHGTAEDDGDGENTRLTTVRVEPTASGFAVADDGCGMSPAARERAFEAGFTTADGGTGLGLAIVDRVAEAHGWTVALVEGDLGGLRVEIGTAGGGTAEPDGEDD